MAVDARPIPPTRLLHQEGFVALVAIAGLFFSTRGIAAALAPTTSWAPAIGAGAAAALLVSGVLFVGRRVVPLRRLELWQRVMVRDWSVGDAAAVAVFSGLAEEALVRAFLQPLIGLIPAAALFALLHLVPDRRLAAWPAIALALGIVFGLLFARWGYPAPATAHIVVNVISLTRLRRAAAVGGETDA